MLTKEKLQDLISYTLANLLYYDRKEDDSLPVGVIENAFKNGEFTIDEMVQMFRIELTNNLKI